MFRRLSTGTLLILLWLLTLAAAPPPVGADPATRVYWTEWRAYNPGGSRIARASVDGGEVETVHDGFWEDVGLKDLAIDNARGHLYWANPAAGLIERSNLDGTARDTVVAGAHPVGLALDTAGERIYWADYTYSDPRLRRADLDGGDVQDLVSASDGCVLEGVVLDLAAGHLYWAERAAQHIKRANLDGSGVTLILACWQGVGHPWGLALAGDRLYWASGEQILSATKTGEDVQTVIDGLPDAPRSLEVDHATGQIYWVTGALSGAVLQRMFLDGSGLETLVSGLRYGYGLALETGEPIAAPQLPAPLVSLRGYPNPFNPTTTLRFDLPAGQPVRLQLHALDGALLRVLLDEWRPAGRHSVRWDGRDGQGRALASGVYLARLVAGGDGGAGLGAGGGRAAVRLTLVR